MTPSRWIVALLDGVIVVYQRVLSPLKPPSCRFDPTCSQYARDALRAHGVLRGSGLAARRLLRCHPFGGLGHDPVPPPRRRASSVEHGR